MDRELRETVYSPASQILNPRALLRGMIVDLRTCRFLAWRLFVRNISAQHRQTMLGYIWLLLPPLVTTAMWVFLNSQNILNVAETDIPYPAFVLTGTILWQGFVDALNSPLQMMQEARAMLSRVNLPHEALFLAGLGSVLFNFTIRLSLLLVIFLWYELPLSASLLLAPLGIAALIGFGFMLGLLMMPLGLLYGDVQRMITVVIGLWFFVTPIIYPPPSSWPASIVAKFNPVSPLIVTTRQWIVGAETTQISSFIFVAVVSLAFMFFGWGASRLAMPHLIERIGS